MRVHSLGARLALVAAGVLVAFFGLAGVALDRAYRASVDEAAREQLQVQLYLLLGAAELDDAGALIMPEVLAESRYVSPASGLLASVLDAEGGRLWSSASSAGHELAFPTVEGGGAFVHGTVAAGDGEVYRVLSYPVVWELGDGAERALVFQVAQSARDAESQVAAFRRTLWLWLAGAGAVLLLAQSVVLRWGLAPLRRVAREIGAIERGERERLGGEYPTELQALTTNLNALLASSASRLQRYRHALDDLAHSLKTPLAVLRGAGSVDRDTLAEQVARMDQAIAYHVQRGATAGRAGLAGAVDAAALSRRIATSLDKVYADRRVVFELDADDDALFAGDPADLTELLGNLLDNAYKWCRSRVRVTVRTVSGQGAGRLAIAVEDDGPGIPEPVRRQVLERGFRADELVPGQGIGLAVVREMVEEAYGGTLELSETALGGARVQVVI